MEATAPELPPLPPAPPPLPDLEPRRFEFRGTTHEYFRIWIVNLCLTILTLGVYSAWAKVRTHRYFYGSTWLDGAPFEYLADPLRILIGRLIAAALLGGYALASNFSPVAQIVMLLLLFLMTPWIIVRSLAFRAHNSAWNSLRFRFDGTTGAAFKYFFAMALLVPISFGLAFPWVKAEQQRFIAARHRYGGRAFSLEVDTSKFYEIYLIAFAMTFGLYFAAIFVTVAAVGLGAAFGQADGGTSAPGVGIVVLMVALLLPIYLGFFAIGIYITARLFNLVWNHLMVGPHRFRADMRARELILLYFTNTLGILGSLGLAIPWAMIRTARYRAEHLTLLPGAGLADFVADARAADSATGQEIGDFFDVDIGL